MTDDAKMIEAMARAIYEARNAGLQSCWSWDDGGLDDEHPGYRDAVLGEARAALAVIRREEGWQRVAEIVPEAYRTVLTQHEDDLFPVCGFRAPSREGDVWLRETEGPEDTYKGRPGRHEPLLREPTHWREPPPPPADRGESA